jgi:hypothetical protein
MEKDNVVSADALSFADLCLAATSLEAIAPSYLRRDGRTI